MATTISENNQTEKNEKIVLDKFNEIFQDKYPSQKSIKPEIETWEDLIDSMVKATKKPTIDIGNAILDLKEKRILFYKDCFIYSKYLPEIKPKEEIKEYSPESIKEMSLKELQDILGLTVKHDNTNKIITFLSMLNAFTEDSQFNISFRSISATGKSYIPIEEAQLFPKDSLMKIAYASPTSFWHDQSIWNPDEQVLEMNLERKIIIFIDQPHDILLQRLRPLLSHDDKKLNIKITDRKEKYGIRTKTVRIIGFCSVIFCTGSLRMEEQESTRSFLLSPETTQEKIRESIELKIKKDSNTMQFLDWINSDKRRLLLKERIEQIRNAGINYIIVDEEEIKKRFFENRKFLKPRDTRDVGRLICLIKGLALFNLWYKKRDDKGNLIASDKDIDEGFKIWNDIAVSQELGISPYIYRMFKEVIEPLLLKVNSGITRKEITANHFKKYGRAVSEEQLRKEILPSLESVGLIYQEPDPIDKRKMLIYPTVEPPVLKANDVHFPKENNERLDNERLDNIGG